MANQRVKRKVPWQLLLFVGAGLTILASLAGVFPEDLVETAYSTAIFPTISHIVGIVSNAVPFSWLDVGIPAAVLFLIYAIRRRQWRTLVAVISLAYLWFFWTWGINYHRPRLATRLHLDPSQIDAAAEDRFIETAIQELNRLVPTVAARRHDRDEIATLAVARVRRVISRIDGTDWPAADRIKRSFLADGWFRIAGIDGAFNPFGHEALLTSGLLPVELPFVISHELAHVRGIPNEGDANLVALLSTVASEDPVFQYSAWLHLWMYMGTTSGSARLAPAVKADLRAIRERGRSLQIPLARSVQTTVLDLHLKANDVDEGIVSYSRFVALALVSWDQWKDYR